MTQQEKFEADYLAAFPKAMISLRKVDGNYIEPCVCLMTLVHEQQAKRHEAESERLRAELSELRGTRARYEAVLDGIAKLFDIGGIEILGAAENDNEMACEILVRVIEKRLRAKAEARAVPAEFFTYSLGGIECVCLRGQPVYFWSFQADRGGLGKTYADMLATELNKLKLYTAPPAQAASLTTPTLNASCVPDVLFDGYSVMQELTQQAKRTTSAEQVSWVLDAVVRLIRKQEQPK